MLAATEHNLAKEIIDEGGLFLAAAARLFPSSRGGGNGVSPSCLFRWVTRGVKLENGRRVYLDATRIAGKFVTAKSAIRRFLETQAPQRNGTAPELRTPTRRQREHAAAAAVLKDKYGIS